MIKQRLQEIRQLFNKYEIAGYIVPAGDEYLSEYPPEYARRLEYITGFTGSNGLAVILKNTILFFTDGRYLTQCQGQLDPDDFEIFDIVRVQDFPWKQYISEDDHIGYDPKLFTGRFLAQLGNLITRPFIVNLVDEIWYDQPPRPSSKIYEYPLKYAGVDYKDKLNKCYDLLLSHKAEALVITNAESVCWLLNVRAHDAPFSPLLLANCMVTKDKVFLFTDKSRVEEELMLRRPELELFPENSFAEQLARIKGIILFDSNFCSVFISNLIKSQNHKEIKDQIQLQKACKNSIEIEYMAKGHVQDAASVCEFLAMIASRDISHLSEYDLGKELTAYRAKRDGYIMDSFATICGFQDNGAIIHYKADKTSARKISGSGLLLIDSGGQYYGATTDITRTICIGAASRQHKYFYTKVLKGHIALASAIFPASKVTGANLDILARQYLWQDGSDYAHGTGHGVGSFLSVHEGPQSISLNSNSPQLAKGMVVSNEPGYYVPGEFGIRIENMMYILEASAPNFLKFEMLTLVPYAKDLIDLNLLNKEELAYLKKYYEKIRVQVQPLLSNAASRWLEDEISWL